MKSAFSLSIFAGSILCAAGASAEASSVLHADEYTTIAALHWEEDCVSYQVHVSSTKRDEEYIHWSEPGWEQDSGTVAYRIQNNCDPERPWSHTIQANVPYSTTIAQNLSEGSLEVDVQDAFSYRCGFEDDGVHRCRRSTAPMTVSVHLQASTPLHVENTNERMPLEGGGLVVRQIFFRARLQNATVVDTAGDYIIDATVPGTMYNRRETQIQTTR